jgi:hypothetical protein
MKKILLGTVFASMLAIAGCGASATVGPTPSASNVNSLQQIGQFTITDLQNADAIAVANNDAIGHACYPALIQFVQSLPGSSPTTTVSGAFSAFETARVTVNTVQGFQIPVYLKLGCSALLVDTQTFLAGLAALGAGAVTGIPPIMATHAPVASATVVVH